MTIADLIRRLEKLDPTMDVMILDGFNGGGTPRELNLGPASHIITAENAEDTADCEGREGEKVVVLGFGCY